MDEKPKYTCIEYRQEMMLLALRRRLEEEGLSQEERVEILHRIRELESMMDLV